MRSVHCLVVALSLACGVGMFAQWRQRAPPPSPPPLTIDRVVFVLIERDRALQYDILRELLRSRQAACGVRALLVHVEQAEGAPFNRGLLANAGVAQALRAWTDVARIVVHDVDMLPESTMCYRAPSSSVVLFSTRASQFNYTRPYPHYFGGVVGFHPAAYARVDGFSNDFWGWGGEDDDLRARVRAAGLSIADAEAGRFLCFDHPRPVVRAQYQHNLRALRRHRSTTGLRTVDDACTAVTTAVRPDELHVVVTPRSVPKF